MGPIDPESSPSNPAPPEIAPHLPPAGEKAILEKYGRLLAIAVVAAIIAGVASSLAGERILDGYHADLYPKLQQHPDPEDMQRWRDARLYSATWTFTAMGGLIGLAMGLAGGVARRSLLASAGAALLGLLLGTSAAASLSLFLVSSFFKRHDPQSGDLLRPLLTHGAIWSAIGALGGLAFGLALGGRSRWKATLVGGLIGAAAATVIYEIVGAIAFASSRTDLPLSDSIATRGMAQLLVAILAAVGAVLALRLSPK